jgi:activator of 2-hydroxyglutaryl-CoA dehydratase/predicted nucleotide-binding protein (sugar kinase/HSP70/actin superfamily)
VLEFLKEIESEYSHVAKDNMLVGITGSGGKELSEHIGAKYVQEVSALCRAVNHYDPETSTVIELGGQDAKIIIFKDDDSTGVRNKFLSMNDKCAGGTGAVIDKISARLGVSLDEISKQSFAGIKIHHVAGKCGVFAETDINSLRVQGVPKDVLMASLFRALVEQNLSVLTRGHTLKPVVLLLGGPNAFLRGMQESWRENLQVMWRERGVQIPKKLSINELIKVPDNAVFYSAIGAAEVLAEDQTRTYPGWQELDGHINSRNRVTQTGSSRGLWSDSRELDEFKEHYRQESFVTPTFAKGTVVEAFIGLDGGSTSTKGVLLNPKREVIAKAYKLSEGNPIEDTQELFAKLRLQVETNGAVLKVLGVGVTGYAGELLKDLLQADVEIVETVAHTEAALHFYDNVDVICDVGGQDIKIMFLKDGRVKDFKLNTQCSAGNGYFLQHTAKDFGIPVEEYADMAFQAQAMPTFGYGCAIFLQSDIVNFQRQGWKNHEIMAGLACVLPKNIWLYVAQIPNFSRLGTFFVLQGGTQHNLAAVKAQADFIKAKFRGHAEQPRIVVHKHCGESGAIGTALEAIRHWEQGHVTSFIGLDATEQVRYTVRNDEKTRCDFCKNACRRTFIDVTAPDIGTTEKKPDQDETTWKNWRLITGNSCEKGSVEDRTQMQEIKKAIDRTLQENPNFADYNAKQAFKRPLKIETNGSTEDKRYLKLLARKRLRQVENRSQLRIGIPRVLNMYSSAPLFNAYFQTLGIPFRNLVFSDYTSEELYRVGAKRGAIDPCYPAKLGIPHVHNLLYVKHAKRPLDIVFFPMIDDLPSELANPLHSRACPAITATPQSVVAAYTKEGNLFQEKGIKYIYTFVNIREPELFEKQMYQDFKQIFGLTRQENRRAIEAGYEALAKHKSRQQQKAALILEELEKEQRIGIILLARPYHNDPGINHEIMLELQKRGYPIFTPESLPRDNKSLLAIFGKDVKSGAIEHPMDINDVWKYACSEMSSRKIWAAKYAARHRNMVALELSSFKCGHDAPLYTLIEEIVEYPGVPYFSFKDLDENKPTGSIRLRIKTIDYFLKRYHEDSIRNAN